MIGDKRIVAIPEGCHPVITFAVPEFLYWCRLVGSGGDLLMRGIAAFIRLKPFEEMMEVLEGERTGKVLS